MALGRPKRRLKRRAFPGRKNGRRFRAKQLFYRTKNVFRRIIEAMHRQVVGSNVVRA